MEIRYAPDPVRFERMTNSELRQEALVDLFELGKTKLTYWDYDRTIVGSIVPLKTTLELLAGKEIASDYFCERREVGILNIGGEGIISIDNNQYNMDHLDGLYIGHGSRKVEFSSLDSKNPAMYYMLSYPAHTKYPTLQAKKADAEAIKLGSKFEANERTIYKYIHPNGIKSCQLVLGFTELAQGSVWNTMPVHTHARRTEVYMYFNLAKDAVVFHLFGKPEATKHIVVRNGQAILSPSWSCHSGAGTSHYSFVWGMGGENQAFDDMDWVDMSRLG